MATQRSHNAHTILTHDAHRITPQGWDDGEEPNGQLDFSEFVALFACSKSAAAPMAYHTLNSQIVEFREAYNLFEHNAEGEIEDYPSLIVTRIGT